MENISISNSPAFYAMFRHWLNVVRQQEKPVENQKPIGLRQVFVQLKKDLIGKDSHRGVTLTYTWLANQFGHFSLGFIPSLVLSCVLCDLNIIQSPELAAAISITCFWGFFEVFNFLGPLLSAGAVGRSLLCRPKYTFSPAWGNIAFDTLTDVMFFTLGAFVAVIFQEPGSIALYVSLILAAALVPISYYWYVTKMYQQSAGYPSQIRLGQWDHEIDEPDRETVQRFLRGGMSGQHLLVFGTEASGKTALSIALATEKSIQHERCIYVSAMKLLSLFCEQEPSTDSDGEELWSWRNVSTLVIDDINPGEPVLHELLPAQTFLHLLSDNVFGAVNRQALREKNVIWVLGTDKSDELARKQWMDMLQCLDIDPRNIHSINLSRQTVRRGRVISFKAGYDYRRQSLQDAAGF